MACRRSTMLVMIVAALPQGLFFQRLAIATLLGLAIGFERQWRQRAAGLHTSTLVAVGAALFVAVPELSGSSEVMRVAAQVVTGVGFLAGGVILREGFAVRGLITAATLWATAAVGLLAGAGFTREACVGAAVIVLTNLAFVPLSDLVSRIPRTSERRLSSTYTLHVVCEEGARARVRERILSKTRSSSLRLNSIASSVPAGGMIQLVAVVTDPARDEREGEALVAALAREPGVTSATWEIDERLS